jgi:membrane associated rhomboid family serine protease
MSDMTEAAITGATLAASGAIWLLMGYLIQRFVFQNPDPTYGAAFATSLSASMLLFSLVALLTFHVRYDYPGSAANGVVQTTR